MEKTCDRKREKYKPRGAHATTQGEGRYRDPCGYAIEREGIR